jgi:fibronectin-binding autotransporter adhesin
MSARSCLVFTFISNSTTSYMQGVTKFIRNANWLSIMAASVAGTFLVVSVANATTTISTDISTGGNVYASSTMAVTGAVNLYSTLNVTGVTTVGNASSTLLTNSGASWFGGAITDTSTLTVSGTATHSGATTLTGTTTASQAVVFSPITADSSLSCFTFYATSSATVLKLSFVATTTVGGQSTNAGILTASYGACN